jgi:DNA-binding response OmpR family regulator
MQSTINPNNRVFAAPEAGARITLGLKAAAGSQWKPMNGKRILIVDDDPVILSAVSMKLKHEGFETITARDGSAAVSAVRKSKPDLILLDITFPPDVAHGGGVAWDGFLIMSWLQRMDEVKGVPFIIISVGDPAKYEKRALAAGATRFFHKPIDSEELLAVIHETLGHRKSETVSA